MKAAEGRTAHTCVSGGAERAVAGRVRCSSCARRASRARCTACSCSARCRSSNAASSSATLSRLSQLYTCAPPPPAPSAAPSSAKFRPVEGLKRRRI